MTASYDEEAARLEALIPIGCRILVIGSTSFWASDSGLVCQLAGRSMATISGAVLITGGVSGVGETVGRAFYKERTERRQEPGVFHVLPWGCARWDYGETLFAGRSMGERREVLGRLRGQFVVIEGGPGTAHEASVALGRGSILIPVGSSGGAASDLFRTLECPFPDRLAAWNALGDAGTSPDAIAAALSELIRGRSDEQAGID